MTVDSGAACSGDREKDAKLKPFGLQRMFLHAYSLTFRRPGAREAFTITAPLPEELMNILRNLEARHPHAQARVQIKES